MPQNVSGKTTNLGDLAAGVCAEAAESAAVLTASENIKTRMIHNAASPLKALSTTQAIKNVLRADRPVDRRASFEDIGQSR